MAITQSNAGGVAARRGFKYQDHVAARFVLEMLGNPSITKIECETTDDITIFSYSGSIETVEYLQVKTTEGDKKWSLTEICARENKRAGSSLVEKSLSCDVIPNVTSRFRIISSRDVYDNLAPLKIDSTRRTSGLTDDLTKSKGSLSKLNFTSKNGNGVSYWVQNLTWEVSGSMEAVKSQNTSKALHLASLNGSSLTHSHIQEIYTDLLNMVATAAEACRITAYESKKLTRDQLASWWSNHLENARNRALAHEKPFRDQTDSFLVEIHRVDETNIYRHLNGYDAGFERKSWRSEQLAEYLSDWLPELTLKASELIGIKPVEIRKKLRLAIRKIELLPSHDDELLLGETILHAIIRHHFESEPISCKIFYRSSNGIRGFNNAHIVHSKSGDQLWLGRTKIIGSYSIEAIRELITLGLTDVLDPDFIKEERSVIVTLREPQHLLPTTLEHALSEYTSVDELLKSICIPVLITYDSSTIKNGYQEDYQSALVNEALIAYREIKTIIPDDLESITIRIFLLPTSSTTDLLSTFKNKIR
jgi:hypothetical protein